MLDSYLKSQPIAVKILKNSINQNKLVHAYLFESNGYNKTNEFIFDFIKLLLCPNNSLESKNCQNCQICQMIDDNCYPEIKIINPDGMWIKKEQLDELQKEFNKKALIGSKKIYIINEAEKMNSSAANSILKFLEEPVSNVVAILVTNNIYQLLDTIISRCQVISLKKEKLENKSELELIACNIFSDDLKRKEFIDDPNSIELVNNVKKYIEYYENNHLDILLHTQKLWFNYFNDKEKNIFGFDIMMMYYRDILNVKISHDIMFFKNEKKELQELANKNSELDICNKISIILQAKQKIKNNINLNLLMDKLIINLEGR